MERIYDIKGYWNDKFETKYTGDKSWSGKIKVDEDGWFEGVVVDSNSTYTKERFVCGIYHEGKVFELYKLTPMDISSPFVFHCECETGGYEGKFDVIGLFGSNTLGCSRICTREIKGSSEEVSNAIDYLNESIKENKESIFDDTCKTFYENAYAQKKSLSRIVLKNYLNEKYTQEEIDEILAETQDVKKKVIEQTLEEVFGETKVEPGILTISDVIRNKNYSGFAYNYRGNVRIDENGWFEGYIKQVGYTHSSFVFGVYYPGKLLDLYSCQGEEPEIFHGRRDEKKFIGSMYYVGELRNSLIHNISFSKSQIKGTKLDEKIELLKSKLKGVCPEFYKTAYEARKELSSTLLKDYENIKFTEEDRLVARDLNNKKREVKHLIRVLNTRGR